MKQVDHEGTWTLGSDLRIGCHLWSSPHDFPPRASLRATNTRQLPADVRFYIVYDHFFDLDSIPSIPFVMSDYEDEMDVDVPKDVQFSSENAGKKRTIADLPVEAQDNLPWSV